MNWFKKKTKNKICSAPVEGLPTSEELRRINLKYKNYQRQEAISKLKDQLETNSSFNTTFTVYLHKDFESELLIELAKNNISVDLSSRYEPGLEDTNTPLPWPFSPSNYGKIRYTVTI
jgi:hypothetical protein